MFSVFRTLWCAGVALALAGALPALGAPLSLHEAVDFALARNPGLAGAQSRAQALAAMPAQASALADPWISAKLSRDEATQMELGFMQELPYPGKRGLRASVARHEAEAAVHDAGDVQLRLAAEVKKAWWRVFYVDRALDAVRRNQVVMRELVSAAQARYRVGEGLQQDVLRAQLGVAKLMEAELQLEGERRVAAARFNALLYRPPESELVLPEKVDETLPRLQTRAALARAAMDTRPALAAQRRQVAAAESQLALAHKDYAPDFAVGAAYEVRADARDMTSVTVAMSLPLYVSSRQDRAVDQRGAALMQQRYAVQDMESRVAAEVEIAVSDYERARAQVELLKGGILPQASQTVAAMLAGYQVGKVDFFNLSDAEITLYDYETRYWQVLSEAQQSLAELVAAVGKEAVYE